MKLTLFRAMDILWYSFLLFLLLWHSRPCRVNPNHLGRETTDAVKGFFIGTVFFRHFISYMDSRAFWHPIDSWFAQLIVVMFLFYSGYGIMIQYEKRGDGYIRTIPTKRILSTLVNFDIAVLLFGLLGLLMGRAYTIKQLTLSLVGWETVGNSNWYIFVILLCYAATFLCFSVPVHRRHHEQMERLFLLGLLLLVYAFVVRRLKPWHWHDTVFAFWGGVAYGLFHKQVEQLLDRHWLAGLVLGFIGTFAFPLLPQTERWLWAVHNARALCFALLVIAATRRFHINCKTLSWCGRNLFPLYIYQRIPMLICKHFHPAAFAGGDAEKWLPCYFAVSLVATLAIAFAFPLFRYPWNNPTKPGAPNPICHPAPISLDSDP